MPESAIHMIVRGMVQGVGFRFFVRQLASRFGVNGWVKNLPDGSVEVYAEGEENVLSPFIESVEAGPRFGRVTGVQKEQVAPSNSHTGFNIEF
jgi:acylphosphatase